MKKILISTVIYGILFLGISLYGSIQDKYDVRLKVDKIGGNGLVTFVLENYGRDVHYQSFSGQLGETEVFYKAKNSFYGTGIRGCIPPEIKLIKRGKGIKFRVMQPYIYNDVSPWRYSLNVSYDNPKPQWMRKAYEMVYKKRLPDTFQKTVKSKLIYREVIEQ